MKVYKVGNRETSKVSIFHVLSEDSKVEYLDFLPETIRPSSCDDYPSDEYFEIQAWSEDQDQYIIRRFKWEDNLHLCGRK